MDAISIIRDYNKLIEKSIDIYKKIYKFYIIDESEIEKYNSAHFMKIHNLGYVYLDTSNCNIKVTDNSTIKLYKHNGNFDEFVCELPTSYYYMNDGELDFESSIIEKNMKSICEQRVRDNENRASSFLISIGNNMDLINTKYQSKNLKLKYKICTIFLDGDNIMLTSSNYKLIKVLTYDHSSHYFRINRKSDNFMSPLIAQWIDKVVADVSRKLKL